MQTASLFCTAQQPFGTHRSPASRFVRPIKEARSNSLALKQGQIVIAATASSILLFNVLVTAAHHVLVTRPNSVVVCLITCLFGGTQIGPG